MASVQMNGSADFTLNLTITETSTNPAANTSVISYSLYINPPGNYESWNLNTEDQSYTLSINGSTVGSGGFTYDFRAPNANVNKVIKSGTLTITHDANGSKTVAASATANTISGALGDGTIASFNTVLTDFVRLPDAPAAPALTRDASGSPIGITSAVASSVVSVTDYNYQFSTDGSSWSGAQAMGTGRTASLTATTTSGYYIQTRAYSSEGWGAWSSHSFIAGVPSAPASISVVRSSRDVSVTAGSSATNGGATITAYMVQSFDGTSWSSPVAMSGNVYVYTNLTPAKTYTFRVYSTNSTGSSTFTTSGTVFVPAGGKRWDGAAFTPTSTVKRWDGSAWTDVLTAKRWDGSAWTDLS